jgi:micrococcal nuclease
VYTYSAYVTGVYDGDTITVDIDLGFDIILKNQKIRLIGINAPEVRGITREDGIKSRNRLRELILKKKITLETIKDKKEKYGRFLGKIYLNGVYINDQLISEGFAEQY